MVRLCSESLVFSPENSNLMDRCNINTGFNIFDEYLYQVQVKNYFQFAKKPSRVKMQFSETLPTDIYHFWSIKRRFVYMSRILAEKRSKHEMSSVYHSKLIHFSFIL